MLGKRICEDCAFYVKLECTDPDELGVNCATVIFCNSFTLPVEIRPLAELILCYNRGCLYFSQKLE
jgi:hypothetical protein